MTDARRLTPQERRAAFGAGETAHALARRLPQIVLAAREAASSALHGAHGRRRAGPGDAFWQFRGYAPGESAQRIDWRRSARDDRLHVREREWEAAHTVWLWIDLSASMDFVSDGALQPKLDRAVTLGLALAEVVSRAGERVGLLGLTRPLAARDVIETFAERLRAAERAGETGADLPPPDAVGPRARVAIVSDCLAPADAFAERLGAIAARGARGVVVAIADPAEETFPFHGHLDLLDTDSTAVLRAGAAQTWRAPYLERLSAHRAALAAACRAHGFGFSVHRTDQPTSAALLRLSAWFAEGGR